MWHIAGFATFCAPPAHSSPLHLVLLLRHYQSCRSEASSSWFILIWDFARDGVCLWLRLCAHLLRPESKRDRDKYNALICRLEIPESAYFWNPPPPDMFSIMLLLEIAVLETFCLLLLYFIVFGFRIRIPTRHTLVCTVDWNFHNCISVNRVCIIYYPSCTL